MWFVYIILCEDGSLYTGISDDVEKRFQVHLSGKGSKYLRTHKPLRVVYQEKVETRSDALKREAEIKKLSRKQKLELTKFQAFLSRSQLP